MRTFKIYSLINFQIYKAIPLTLVTVLHIISPGLTKTELVDTENRLVVAGGGQ